MSIAKGIGAKVSLSSCGLTANPIHILAIFFRTIDDFMLPGRTTFLGTSVDMSNIQKNQYICRNYFVHLPILLNNIFSTFTKNFRPVAEIFSYIWQKSLPSWKSSKRLNFLGDYVSSVDSKFITPYTIEEHFNS